ncbi:hypothetical protein [Hyphomicrobium sp. ghe19]|uniref:hypothetical protein n=1 Tax=Hyphomicrobium sp. ghe19 TaxID=2682968 RepID=UPI001367872A|nr:hypothetical protein HYPP_00142 [Hyphomicrobium sp. ghe19]
MAAEDPSLRERLVGLKVQRDELAVEIAELQKRVANGEQRSRRKSSPGSLSC